MNSSMEIIIGSHNPAKVGAVEEVFHNYKVTSQEVSSNVSNQPSSDAETRLGAINRAYGCHEFNQSAYGIGLEGGVMSLGEELYLCNWGALVTPNNKLYVASGARIPLPEVIKKELALGKELGDIMDVYAKREGVRKKEGAIGIFTNELISRKEMFHHVVKLLYGQYQYNK